MKTLTATAVERLKLEAKQLKKSTNIKQTTALAQIAHREGYSSWEVLMASSGGLEIVGNQKPVSAEKARRAAKYGKVPA